MSRADARGKRIVGLRSSEHEKSTDLGKMVEGFWQRMPFWDKASSLDELEIMMRRLYGPVGSY